MNTTGYVFNLLNTPTLSQMLPPSFGSVFYLGRKNEAHEGASEASADYSIFLGLTELTLSLRRGTSTSSSQHRFEMQPLNLHYSIVDK
ncbi:MAG: hypothetical protein MUO40_06930 [Anaerolineaceae bacterium]|nr:hypothetical protein [Anaerolineaceae bacterium]